jgi:very-short-patch-repair endonuclease
MRVNSTVSERALWEQLRANRLGVAFRRQVPIAGKYIVDFLAPSARLIVEVDGGYHSRRVAADARRDRKLVRLGYRVLHLEAEVVTRQLPVAVARIREALRQTG